MLLDIPGIEELTDAERARVGAIAAWAIRVSRAKTTTMVLSCRLEAALVALVGGHPVVYSETEGVWSCYGRETERRVVLPLDVAALYDEWARANADCFERAPT